MAISTGIKEDLFLNTLEFDFPEKPLVFWFSKTKLPSMRRLKSKDLIPSNIRQIIPDYKNGDEVFTSFEHEVEGALALPIDFNDPDNYHLVKRFYNKEICHYFHVKGKMVEEQSHTHDNIIWIESSEGGRRDCTVYDKFTIKVDFDHFHNRPRLVLSYHRTSQVLNTSVEDLLGGGDPFFDDEAPSAITPDLISRIVYYETRSDGRESITIGKYSDIARWRTYDSANAYPIMWSKLERALSMEKLSDDDKEEENIQYASGTRTVNKYLRYFNKINFFYDAFLNNDFFRELIPISHEGFTWADPVQIGHATYSSKELLFGRGQTNYNPQIGINNGPFERSPYTDIQLIYIFPKAEKNAAASLLRAFRDGYGNENNYPFHLKKYTQRDIVAAGKGMHIQFENKNNPVPEIENAIRNMIAEERLNPNTRYFAVYLTAVGKYESDVEAHRVYYRVKELLLRHKIASQCVDIDKMNIILANDQRSKRDDFKYTLQNMAIAMNAKLGGTPWRISTEKQDELVIGIGAFINRETKTRYIGSAFSFDNTGQFNSFKYFQKDQLSELAGTILMAVEEYSAISGVPDRIILHFYKDMSLAEYTEIEEKLRSIDLDIPVYIVSINKSESEDILLFDAYDRKCTDSTRYKDMMPYSGRYINLGNKTYLLCNNTRYERSNFYPRDGYPFPVKIRIECPFTNNEIDTATIQGLIDQVYQFSRIYFKSVRQQNLPVTIKYPSIIAELAPYFEDGIPEGVGTDTLWFL